MENSNQPVQDAVCRSCGHNGAEHLVLAGQSPHCRCGCRTWVPAGGSPRIVSDEKFQAAYQVEKARWTELCDRLKQSGD